MRPELLEELKDKVAVLTLNRPDRLNAMSPPMLDALLEALPRLPPHPPIGVVVLPGAGPALCAGGGGEGEGGGGRRPRGPAQGEGPVVPPRPRRGAWVP